MSNWELLPLTPTVEGITELNIQGNIIPHSWYQHITFDVNKKGIRKPDIISILLLSDFVYWYRATEYRDESSGNIIGYGRKFHGELLQKSQEALSTQFGFSKRQIKDALYRLEQKELIKRDYKVIKTKSGLVCSNVLFIDLNVAAIKEITFSILKHPRNFKNSPGYVQTADGTRLNVSGQTSKRHTYTESTTENTNKEVVSPQATTHTTTQISGPNLVAYSEDSQKSLPYDNNCQNAQPLQYSQEDLETEFFPHDKTAFVARSTIASQEHLKDKHSYVPKQTQSSERTYQNNSNSSSNDYKLNLNQQVLSDPVMHRSLGTNCNLNNISPSNEISKEDTEFVNSMLALHRVERSKLMVFRELYYNNNTIRNLSDKICISCYLP